MTWELGDIDRVKEYKGCAIRAASYRIRQGDWAPQARFVQRTERGPRQFWVQSFEHLFAVERPNFATCDQADEYAFRLAEALIDRIESDFQPFGKFKRLFSRRRKSRASSRRAGEPRAL